MNGATYYGQKGVGEEVDYNDRQEALERRRPVLGGGEAQVDEADGNGTVDPGTGILQESISGLPGVEGWSARHSQCTDR